MSALDMFPETRVDPAEDPDRRYTTPETMALCMKLAGVTEWDLDVAADEESHWAPKWFGIAQDGLIQSWLYPVNHFGPWRIWCNPPFSDIAPWLERAWRFYGAMKFKPNFTMAMLLPANRTEQPWWQEYVEQWRDGRHPDLVPHTHFLPTRVRYGHPGNPKGIRAGSPPFASVLLVWRST